MDNINIVKESTLTIKKETSSPRILHLFQYPYKVELS